MNDALKADFRFSGGNENCLNMPPQSAIHEHTGQSSPIQSCPVSRMMNAAENISDENNIAAVSNANIRFNMAVIISQKITFYEIMHVIN